jgi:transcription initiation factor TFIIIB Brf1 subunit/transcription initiation factor TFIIB
VCSTEPFSLPQDIIQAGKTTADNLSSLSVTEGKKPQTIAGTALVFVMNELPRNSPHRKTIEEIAERVNIKSQTILELHK